MYSLNITNSSAYWYHSYSSAPVRCAGTMIEFKESTKSLKRLPPFFFNLVELVKFSSIFFFLHIQPYRAYHNKLFNAVWDHLQKLEKVMWIV